MVVTAQVGKQFDELDKVVAVVVFTVS
jgi:hypothetical protein